MHIKWFLFLTLSFQTIAWAANPSCAVTFDDSKNPSAMAEIKQLQAAITNETNPVIKSLLVKKRDAHIESLLKIDPQTKIDLTLERRETPATTEKSQRQKEKQKLKNTFNKELFKEKFEIKEEIDAFLWSDSGRFLVMATHKGNTVILDFVTSKITSIEGFLEAVHGEEVVIHNSILGKVIIYTLEDLSEVARFDGEVFRQDNGEDHLIPIKSGDQLKVLDLNSKKTIYTHAQGLTKETYSANTFKDHIVLVGSDGVMAFDVKSGKQIYRVDGWSQLSANGNWLVKKNLKQDGVIYDAKTGEELFTFSEDASNSYQHGDMILLRLGIVRNQRWTLIDMAKQEVVVDGMSGEDPLYLLGANKVVYVTKSWAGVKQINVYDVATKQVARLDGERIYSHDGANGYLAIGKKKNYMDDYPTHFEVYDLNSMQKKFEYTGKSHHGGIYFVPTKNVIAVDDGKQFEFLYDMESQSEHLDFARFKKQNMVIANPQNSHAVVPKGENGFSFIKIGNKK